MKKPNFFIIGAPKCGTTSMARWLSEHPNIYMSPVKEPNFFNTDDKYTVTRTLREYEALFKGTGPEHIAVGEASVWYLFSQEAVPNILSYCDDPRFIVMVRNPIEMAYSLHQQELYSGNEHIRDFRKAWYLQSKRAKGLEISPFCIEPKRLLYGPVCKLGEQLERLYTLVPKRKVLVLVLDDVKGNPRREYLKVLEFLGVPDDGRNVFPVYNPAKAHRSQLMGRMIALTGRRVSRVKLLLGIQGGLGILNVLNRLNTVKAPRPPLDQEIRRELAAYFEEDVKLLSKLMNRDFSYWLSVGEETSSKESGEHD